MADEKIQTHPVQRGYHLDRNGARVPQVVSLKAYEVYSVIHGEQPAMITGHCRGGFGSGELIAYLYASSFPKSEWSKRVDEALRGMEYL